MKRFYMATAAALITVLSGCASNLPRTTDEALEFAAYSSYTGLQGIDDAIPADRVNSLPRSLSQQAIEALADGDLETANRHFNQALMFDPANSKLHWFNGVTYHLRAVLGEASQFDLAREAYLLSIRFEPSSWSAHYQLGLLYRDRNQNAAAQDAFAEALLYRPKDAGLLYQMMTASYYNHDPESARAALSQLQLIEPDSPRTLRATPIVAAAMGDSEGADQGVMRYAQYFDEPGDVAEMETRVDDWQWVYENYTVRNVQTPINTQAGAADAPVTQAPVPSAPESSGSHDGDTDRHPIDDMVIVDVAIIESQEDLGTRKGVNLLNGLTLQYGLTGNNNESRTRTASGIPPVTDNINESFSRTLTQAISIPQLDYSLNIFNSAIFKNEVLARPTLVGLNGHQSRFFAGSNVHAAATASSTVGAVTGGQAVQINKDIGIDMSITPTLQPNGSVKVDVDITRTFLETPDSAIDYEFKMQTAKTHVTASVVLEFGETLILSGLSESESELIRDGVPVLQDIPIVQYFFSEERTLDFRRSALVLITPRRAFAFNDEDSVRSTVGISESMMQLRRRFNEWFKPAPHWVSALQHLQEGGLFREFREGDIELETWAETEAFRRRFGDVVEFLYY